MGAFSDGNTKHKAKIKRHVWDPSLTSFRKDLWNCLGAANKGKPSKINMQFSDCVVNHFVFSVVSWLLSRFSRTLNWSLQSFFREMSLIFVLWVQILQWLGNFLSNSLCPQAKNVCTCIAVSLTLPLCGSPCPLPLCAHIQLIKQSTRFD